MVVDLRSSLTYFVMTHPLLVAGKLPIKTLVTKQLPTNTHTHTHTHTYTLTLQTGPKGVLTDYYRTQQNQRRQALLEEKKRRELIAKHTATVKSYVRRERERERERERDVYKGECLHVTNTVL